MIAATFVMGVAGFEASGYEQKSTLASFGFEELPTDFGWRTYDLDGKSTTFFGKPRGWYMEFESKSENGVCAATALFNYDVDYNNFKTPVTVPANDWLFSPAVSIPESGSFRLFWDTRSAGNLDYEDYEVRVIDFDLLESIEAGLSSSMTLAQVSDKMLENSTLLATVKREAHEWTTHSVSVNALRGRKVSFIWRYVSNHTQMIYLDNFLVAEEDGRSLDLTDVSYPMLQAGYAQVPRFMVSEPAVIAARMMNVDAGALTDVKSKVVITDAGGNSIHTDEVGLGTLQSGEQKGVEVQIGGELAARLMSEPYSVTLTSTSANGNDDVLSLAKEGGFELTENTLAWEKETSGYYSIGFADPDKKIGQRFPIEHNAMLNSVVFKLTDTATVGSVTASVYEDLGSGKSKKVAESGPVAVTAGQSASYTAEFPDGVALEKGKTYIVALSEESNKYLGLGSCSKDHGKIAVQYTSNEGRWIEIGDRYTFDIRLNMENRISGVEEIAGAMPLKVTVAGGVLTLAGTGAYQIYDLSGRLLNAGELTEGQCIIDGLAHGLYIVRSGRRSVKIML